MAIIFKLDRITPANGMPPDTTFLARVILLATGEYKPGIVSDGSGVRSLRESFERNRTVFSYEYWDITAEQLGAIEERIFTINLDEEKNEMSLEFIINDPIGRVQRLADGHPTFDVSIHEANMVSHLKNKPVGLSDMSVTRKFQQQTYQFFHSIFRAHIWHDIIERLRETDAGKINAGKMLIGEKVNQLDTAIGIYLENYFGGNHRTRNAHTSLIRFDRVRHSTLAALRAKIAEGFLDEALTADYEGRLVIGAQGLSEKMGSLIPANMPTGSADDMDGGIPLAQFKKEKVTNPKGK